MNRRAAVVAAGLAGPVLLLLPPLRQWLESSMTWHMLLQAPLLVLCGALAAGGLSTRARARLDAWNGYGIAGLFATALVLALMMIPRLLDLAVADLRFDAVKALALFACGAALRLSWRPAGALVQGFFLGNVLPMTGAVGQMYQDSPLRLCNAYLLGDQVQLGRWLVALAVAAGVGWFAGLVRTLMRREAAGLPPSDAGSREALPADRRAGPIRT